MNFGFKRDSTRKNDIQKNMCVSSRQLCVFFKATLDNEKQKYKALAKTSAGFSKWKNTIDRSLTYLKFCATSGREKGKQRQLE